MTLAAVAVMAAAGAENKTPAWINNVRLSGYGMAQYQYSGQDGAESNSFNLRLLRLSLDGRIATDWYWKAQVQFNGNTSTLGNSPRLVDLFAEWQRFGFMRVKVGQFKRPFSFDNPLHPIDQGFLSVAQSVSRLVYFADRSGAHPSNGRDIGVQLEGDLVKNAAGRPLLHYQAGVFNGQGINTKDVDQQKELIGGVWVMPVAGLRLGVFGSEGSYSRKGSWKNLQGNDVAGVRRLPQHRYAISGEYKFCDWTVRSEYIHSTGKAFQTTYNSSADLSKCDVNEALGAKADGAYALVIAPVLPKKLYAKVRYDLYRPSASWRTSKTLYEVGANFMFNKNVQLNTEYLRVNDRSLARHDYDMVDLQLDFRF